MLAALASAVLWLMVWFRPTRISNQPQTLTLEGKLPDDPAAEIRANFPDLNYTATCRASELGQPGQAFKWTVQLPGKPGQVEVQTVSLPGAPVAAPPVPVLAQTVQVSPPPAAPAPEPLSASSVPRDPKREARLQLRRQRHNQRRELMALRHRRRR